MSRPSFVCPKCGGMILSADVDVTADTALCRACESAFLFSELVEPCPPDGTSVETRSGGFRVVASTRNPWAWLLIPFLGVWIAIGWRVVSVLRFVNFWDVLMFVFAIPFVLGLLLTCMQILLLAWGRIEISRDGDEGSIFRGIGQTGWTRRFRWSDLRSVQETTGLLRPRAGPPFKLIELEFARGRGPLKFGTLLNQERRWFLMSRLRSQIISNPQ